MSFSSENFDIYMNFMISGIAAGFMIGFMSWAIGYAIYGIKKICLK